jgi:hypothetical protein
MWEWQCVLATFQHNFSIELIKPHWWLRLCNATFVCTAILIIIEGHKISFPRFLVPIYYWKTDEKPETDPLIMGMAILVDVCAYWCSVLMHICMHAYVFCVHLLVYLFTFLVIYIYIYIYIYIILLKLCRCVRMHTKTKVQSQVCM